MNHLTGLIYPSIMSEENVPEASTDAPPTSTEEQEENIEIVEPPLEPACE